MDSTTVTPRLRAELQCPDRLDEGGVAELTLTNSGSVRDVYRVVAETEYHERTQADPSIVRLEPGDSRTVTVAAHAPVAVRVYSEMSGQRCGEAYLSR